MASKAGLPPYVLVDTIRVRLPLIFPKGTQQRNELTNRVAARTVFAMLYTGALVGTGRVIGPKHVYGMTDDQALKTGDADRLEYAMKGGRPGWRPKGKPWYADTTRETIRDDTIRSGLVPVGAAVPAELVITTSSTPRYALLPDFAALFDPKLAGKRLARAIEKWQDAHLTRGALARVRILGAGAAAGATGVRVTFPNGETKLLGSGASSLLAKAVIEEFARRFLAKPALIWLSESGKKVTAYYDDLARDIGLRISPDKNLPDVILVDLEGRHPLLVFVELAFTGGEITPSRQEALLKIAVNGGYDPRYVAFVTAYVDRSATAFRRTVGNLAWRGFAWFEAEPDKIMVLRDGSQGTARLKDML
jgi:hypothetical protein